MRFSFVVAAAAAIFPCTAIAQRGGGGGGGSSAPSSPAAAPSSGARSPSSRDLAETNPAALLISKRKKVPLADSIVTQLKAVEKKIDERNAALFSSYDSVRKWTMPISVDNSSRQPAGLRGGMSDATIASSGPSEAEQAKMQSSMRDLRGLMSGFRERRKADVADALAPVPEAQKKAAADLLTKQDGDLDKLLGVRP